MSYWFKFRNPGTGVAYYGEGSVGEAAYLLRFSHADYVLEMVPEAEVATVDMERNGPSKLSGLIEEIHDVQRHNDTVTIEARIIEAIRKLQKMGGICSTPAITRFINASGFKTSVTTVRKTVNALESAEILEAHGGGVAAHWNFA